jgi:F-type H+-transporting ATPase subunit epsilon
MEKVFDLKVITPSGKEFEGKVSSVTCPGTVGSFQVLYNHAPLLSSLDIGPIEIGAADKTLSMAVSGGFAQVYHNSVLILAETAELSDRIDVERASEAKKRAEDRLSAHRKEIDVRRAEAALHRAINRLKVAGSL